MLLKRGYRRGKGVLSALPLTTCTSLLCASFPHLQYQLGFGSIRTAPFSVALINSAHPLLYHISIWGTVELAFTLEG